jgi:hypothetical protein
MSRRENRAISARRCGKQKMLLTLMGSATASVVGSLLSGGQAYGQIDNVSNWNGSNYSSTGTYVTYNGSTFGTAPSTAYGNNNYGIINSTTVGGTFQSNFGPNGTPGSGANETDIDSYYFGDTTLQGGSSSNTTNPDPKSGLYGYNTELNNLSATGSITFSNPNNADPSFEIGFFNDTFKQTSAGFGQKLAFTNYVGVGFGFGNYNSGDNGGNSNAFRLQANGSGSQYVNAGTYDFTLSYIAPDSTVSGTYGTDTITFYTSGDNGNPSDVVATASNNVLNPANVPNTETFSANLYDFGIYQPRGGAVTASTFNVSLTNLNYTGESNPIVGTPQWTLNSSGDYNTSSNWSGGVPNAVDATANFLGAIISNATVNTAAPITLGTINFNNANTYDLTATGSGALTLQTSTGNAQVNVLQGTQEISLPTTVASNTTLNIAANSTLEIAGPLTVSAGETVTQTGAGSVLYQSSVTLQSNAGITFVNSTHATQLNLSSGATATLTAPTLEVDQLINSGGTLNIENNSVIINYGSGADPISSIVAMIVSGYHSGTWTGLGITSTNARSNSSYGIGYADYRDPGNPAGLSSGQIEIAYTLLGDANLDYKVNGADFTLMASNFNDSVTNGWDEGDFNYSNTVNGDDFVLLANNFNQFASQSSVSAADLAALDAFAAANGISLTSVPEPMSFGILTMGAVGLLGRRRRQSPSTAG